MIARACITRTPYYGDVRCNVQSLRINVSKMAIRVRNWWKMMGMLEESALAKWSNTYAYSKGMVCPLLYNILYWTLQYVQYIIVYSKSVTNFTNFCLVFSLLRGVTMQMG